MTDVTKCKHWRWMPGMLAKAVRDRPLEDVCRRVDRVCDIYPNSTPDLTDPATLGCLLHLVREAWAPNVVVFGGWRAVHIYAPTAVTQWVEGDLAPYVWESDGLGEAEALIAALEAAP